MNKLVSVVMTVYNTQDYLTEAIQSILNQTYTDFEFIIIDDCSTDHSLQIAMDFQNKDGRIQVHHLQKNMGIANARNAGIELAKGKYIAWMDSDDISMPERIEKELTFLESNPQISVVSSNAKLVNTYGEIIGEVCMPQTQKMIEWVLCFTDPIINPATMVRSEIYKIAGGYRNLAENKSEFFPEDFDLWVRLIHKIEFYNLQDYLLLLRKHEQNITKTLAPSILVNSIKVCGWYLESLNSPKIKASDAELLWNPGAFHKLPSIIKILSHLLWFFTTKKNITSQERLFIWNNYFYQIYFYSKQVLKRIIKG